MRLSLYCVCVFLFCCASKTVVHDNKTRFCHLLLSPYFSDCLRIASGEEWRKTENKGEKRRNPENKRDAEIICGFDEYKFACATSQNKILSTNYNCICVGKCLKSQPTGRTIIQSRKAITTDRDFVVCKHIMAQQHVNRYTTHT